MQSAGGGRKAVVVGAGPAGAASAISLARLGFTVDVIEVRDFAGELGQRSGLHEPMGGLGVCGPRVPVWEADIIPHVGSDAASQYSALRRGCSAHNLQLRCFTALLANICHAQRRPDPALNGPEMRQTFIMGLALRSVGPLQMLGVRLPEDDWIGELSPNHGAIRRLLAYALRHCVLKLLLGCFSASRW